MKTTHKTVITITIFILLIAISWILIRKIISPYYRLNFNSERALQDISYQVNLGPRTIGSAAHDRVVEWISSELQISGWTTTIQHFTWNGYNLQNIIAKRGQGAQWIILGAHYDSRFIADRDPDPQKWLRPVPGANDGASGVAVLMELARVIPVNLDKQIWLVFFDAEDNGNYKDWDWLIGSQEFVSTLEGKPDKVVVVDMIGDADLNIYKEKNSEPRLTDEIWDQAKTLGFSQFIPEYKYRVLDDHVPFLQAEIPAIDIIDLDYPSWHTTEDTLDKISADSLEAVGETLLHWLVRK
jgi:glutaminyl-peptide cyclotransferase